VRQTLTDTRLVTLTGAGGVGKTRLAVEVAAQMTAEFSDGVWYVDLTPIADPDVVPVTVARALGMPDRPGSSTVETLLRFIHDRQMLVVLDNCEHLLDASAELVAALLRAGLAWFDAVLSDGSEQLAEVAPAIRARAASDRDILHAWVVATDSMQNAEDAVALAREVGDPALLARALIACDAAAINRGVADRRYLAEALDLARARRTVQQRRRRTAFRVTAHRADPPHPVYTKLGLTSRVQLVQEAARHSSN
jgi:hypothetical protein